MRNEGDLDLQRMLLRGAAWRVERVGTAARGEQWSVVVSDEQHRRIGAYTNAAFTSYDAAREWLLGFFLRAVP